MTARSVSPRTVVVLTLTHILSAPAPPAYTVTTLLSAVEKRRMVHLGTVVSGVGLLTLLHAGFSAAHFQQFKKSSGGGDSAPLDAALEAIAGFFVCVVGVLYSAEAFLPIRGAAGGGKSLDSAESTREFEVFQHRGRSLRKRLA